MGNKLGNRSMRILALSMSRFILHNSLLNPRRNQKRGDANTQTPEVEGDGFPIAREFGIGQVIAGRDTHGRGDMVGETTVLIEGKNEEGILPLRGRAEGLVDGFHERLAHVYG